MDIGDGSRLIDKFWLFRFLLWSKGWEWQVANRSASEESSMLTKVLIEKRLYLKAKIEI